MPWIKCSYAYKSFEMLWYTLSFSHDNTGVWTQGLTLVRQSLYCWRHSSQPPLLLRYGYFFQIGSCVFAPSSYLWFPCSSGNTQAWLHSAYELRWDFAKFFPGWFVTLLISTSWVAGITVWPTRPSTFVSFDQDIGTKLSKHFENTISFPGKRGNYQHK
jgi:hypothetical protein